MFHEWRAAVRSVVRRPGFALAVILTLTLGIGANSAIFSAIDTVLLKPLPYPAADRLVAVYEASPGQNQATSLVAPVRLEEWNRLNHSFDGLAGSYFENVTETTGPLPERLAAMRTSPRFFSVLGTPAAVGRTPSVDEERFGGLAAVVISDSFWRARFNADPSAVGRSLVLGDLSRTIVGVMPPSFRYPSAATEAWIPAQMSAGLLRAREARFYTALGRLKPGVTPDQAQSELSAVQQRLGEAFPQTDQGWTARLVPLKEEQVGGVRRSLWLLFGAVFLVLLAACGNVACLLLADASRREHEIAVRFALGATRRTIISHLLREGLLLAISGSLGALVLARWAIEGLRAAALRMPRVAELHVDVRLIAFTLTLGVLTTVLFALAPALQATRRDVSERLARTARGQMGGRQWLLHLLVTAQVTLAIVLLVGAGLLIRSFSRLQHVAPGFDPQHVLTFRMSAAWSERPETVLDRQLRTLQRLTAIPGVMSAALDSVLPARSEIPPGEFTIIGRETGEHYLAVPRQVSADYFSTMRIRVLQGDTCRDDPRMNAPLKAVVSRTFADRFFVGDTPIGHHILQRFPMEIVGVVADVREQGLMKDPEPTVYYCGLMAFWPDPYYLVRTDPSRGLTMAAIREALHEIEPRRAMYAAAPLISTLSESLSQPWLNTVLLTLFAAMALTLAAIGLYGMLAHFVCQRRREIGVRMALGARPAQVFAQVVRHGAAVTGIGVALGLTGAFALARVMTTLVFNIPARDPVTFVIVPTVLALVAAAAMIIPAKRAVSVEPMEALREN
jgi:putative ABC transport system permease protein